MRRTWPAVRRVDLPSLVAGAALCGLGVLLLLDRVKLVDLRFAAVAPAALAALGAILVALGLSRGG
jgi:hypothetical protein